MESPSAGRKAKINEAAAKIAELKVNFENVDAELP